MDSTGAGDVDATSSQQDVNQLLTEIQDLKKKLAQKEQELLKRMEQSQTSSSNKLSNEDITRFSRQLILPNFGVSGQMKMKNGSVLIVGMGGLGKTVDFSLLMKVQIFNQQVVLLLNILWLLDWVKLVWWTMMKWSAVIYIVRFCIMRLVWAC